MQCNARAGLDPVGIVLGGTPGLVDTLDASNATFWIRGLRLPVSLLSNDEAHSVLAHPLAQAGVTAEESALAALAQAAAGYPFFLQLYGEAAWNALRQSDAGALSTEQVEVAIKAVESRRKKTGPWHSYVMSPLPSAMRAGR